MPFYRPPVKGIKLLVAGLVLPLWLSAQSLTGLWTGAIRNDSTTVRKDQLFEIALTEYKGKVHGYSRSEFIVNDTLYYIVKRVKGTIEGDVCMVTDDEILAYNFRGKLDKGIRVTSTFRRNKADSTWYLAGDWKTNATRKYYAVTGKLDLQAETDLAASKLFPHLEELKLADQVDFYRERTEGLPIAKIVRPERINSESRTPKDLQTETVLQPTEPILPAPSITEPEPVIGQPVTTVPRSEKTELPKQQTPVTGASGKPLITARMPEQTPAALTTPAPPQNTGIDSTTGKTLSPVTSAPIPAKPSVPTEKRDPAAYEYVDLPVPVKTDRPATKPEAAPVTAMKQPLPQPVSSLQPGATIGGPTPASTPNAVRTRTLEELTRQVASISGRRSEFSQVVEFRSDSLQLALYDNGEIDGDTVSVYYNGEILLARQGLKASAIRKTIYVRPGTDEDFTLVLFADNLGKYPPNTGLLVVYDGDDTYHLRFSSDFKKSSGIVFRRKRP
ncbi:MAG: hypothetical protein RJA57_1003 [Bacteroidota bacterium]